VSKEPHIANKTGFESWRHEKTLAVCYLGVLRVVNMLDRECTSEKKMSTVLTLVDLQLDAQNSYLFIYNTFIKILYMFRALPCSSSGGLHRNCIYAAFGIVRGCIYTITT
jgi:hypothetical protein